MKYIRVIIILCLGGASILFTSCSLFSGHSGEENNHSVSGGEVVWRLTNNLENIVQQQPLISDGMVYFLQDGQLKAVTLEEGKLRWKSTIDPDGTGGDYAHKMLQSGEKLFFDEGYRIKAFDKKDGSLHWKAKVADEPRDISGNGFPIMSQDQTYLYAGRKGYVVQLRKSDGHITRRYPLDRLVPEGITQGSTEPIISPFGDNILYTPGSYFDKTKPTAQASGGNIFAYNASTGSLLWEHRISVTVPDYTTQAPNDSLTGSPNIYNIAVTQDKVVVLAGFYIVALNRMTGDPVWKTYFPRGFDVGLAVKGNAVYAASNGTVATRVGLATGKILWKRDILFSNGSIPTVQDGRLYFTNDGEGVIWVLDAKNGSVIYKKPPPNFKDDDFDIYVSSLAVGEGYMVNVGSKAVYCLTVP